MKDLSPIPALAEGANDWTKAKIKSASNRSLGQLKRRKDEVGRWALAELQSRHIKGLKAKGTRAEALRSLRASADTQLKARGAASTPNQQTKTNPQTDVEYAEREIARNARRFAELATQVQRAQEELEAFNAKHGTWSMAGSPRNDERNQLSTKLDELVARREAVRRNIHGLRSNLALTQPAAWRRLFGAKQKVQRLSFD